MKRLTRLFSLFLMVCLVNVTVIHTARAALIGTEQVARAEAVEQGTSAHARLDALLARADVRAQLERLGVGTDDARERVAALTDEEAALLAQQIENAPAGGIIGAILLVFFVLLVTDILGFTKVYPFTRPIK
ncbi:MAG TPA: PA2779 family protein [Rhodocyclaceae bacterium]|nr:PA2779 family protein [Rhodocyclaceae bacterium]